MGVRKAKTIAPAYTASFLPSKISLLILYIVWWCCEEYIRESSTRGFFRDLQGRGCSSVEECLLSMHKALAPVPLYQFLVHPHMNLLSSFPPRKYFPLEEGTSRDR